MQEHHTGWTERVRVAQRYGTGRRALLEELATYAYHYPRRKIPTLDEDAAGEFYLFCHAKLERVIDRFRDHGKPFERYVNSVLSWQLRTFLARRKCIEQAWKTSLRAQLWDGARAVAAAPVKSAPPPPPTAVPAADPPWTTDRLLPGLSSATAQRRLLYAVLKAGHRLDDDHLSAAAPAVGCDVQRLRVLVDELGRRRAPAQRRLAVLRTRRNLAFAQLQIWSAAAHEEEDAGQRARAAARAARYRRTVVTAQSELARVRVAPSNREIGALLGVPKGTVDTGLYWLKRQIAVLYARADGVGTGEQQSA